MQDHVHHPLLDHRLQWDFPILYRLSNPALLGCQEMLTLSSSKCIGDSGVSWRKRQRAQSIPSCIPCELHLSMTDQQKKIFTIDVPLFKPRTVMSKAWPDVPLTVCEVMLYSVRPTTIPEGTEKAMGVHSGLFNETSKPHPIANRPNGGDQWPCIPALPFWHPITGMAYPRECRVG